MNNQHTYRDQEDKIPEAIRAAGKKNPFVVPEGYFDALTDRVLDTVQSASSKEKRGSVIIHLSHRLRAVAASVGILLFAGLSYALITQVILPAIQEENPETTQPSMINESDTSGSTDPSHVDLSDPNASFTAKGINLTSIPPNPPANQKIIGRIERSSGNPSNPISGIFDHGHSGIPPAHQTASIGSGTTGRALPKLNDTIVCKGSVIHYQIPFHTGQFEAVWSLNGQSLTRGATGTISIATSALKPGIHQLTLMLKDKSTQQFVHVQNATLSVVDQPVIDVEKKICSYGKARLSVGPLNPNWEYQWSTGETTGEIMVSESGEYWIRINVKGGNCFTIDTFKVTVMPKPVLNLGADRTICANDQITLKINNPGNQFEIRWHPDNTTGNEFVFSSKKPGIYKIKAVLTACKVITDELVIHVADCNISIPNIFTPNGDGINDLFAIKGLEAYPASKLLVTDRNGQVVFESNDYQNTWDGGDLPNGTYFYLLYPGGSESLYRKGTVTILR